MTFRYRSPQTWVDYWRRYYGPTLKAFEAVCEEGRAALEADPREHRTLQPGRRRHDGRAERTPRGRHHQALTQRSRRRLRSSEPQRSLLRASQRSLRQGERAIHDARPVSFSSRALWQSGRMAASRRMAARKWRSNGPRGYARMTAPAHVVDNLERRAPHIQSRRPVEQDGLDAVVERHAGLHVEDDRDRRAVGLACAASPSVRGAAARAPRPRLRSTSCCGRGGAGRCRGTATTSRGCADRSASPQGRRSRRPSSTPGSSARAGSAAASGWPRPRPRPRPRPAGSRCPRSAWAATAQRSLQDLMIRGYPRHYPEAQHETLVRPASSPVHVPRLT